MKRTTMPPFVGHFRELSRNPDHPSLVEARGALPADVRERVAKYLRNGTVMLRSLGRMLDWFDPSVSIAGGHDTQTDGTYSWGSYLPYYVENYGVGLPKEFMAYVEPRAAAMEAEEKALAALRR
jgi:hypothetical protein